MDEREKLDAIQSRLKSLTRPLRQFADKKWTKPPTIDELEKMYASIPKGTSVSEEVDSAVSELRTFISDVRKSRGDAFGRLVSEFIRDMKARGENPAETGSGWRIGEVELELKPEAYQARVLYNQAPLVPASGWVIVVTKDDLSKISSRAKDLLQESLARISDDVLRRLIVESYETAMAKRVASGKPRPELVPILDLHRVFRIALVTHELEGQKPDKSLLFANMPRWMFLHVLDRYQRMVSAGDQMTRLVFQTGSQAEQAKGMGYMLGGLDPHQKYRIYCHILRNS